MIMAYHGAAPDGPSPPLATKTSCGTASLPEADETADELGPRWPRQRRDAPELVERTSSR